MNNLKCRHWTNLIYKNNPDVTNRFNVNFGPNPVSVHWMDEIWKNNPDVSWGKDTMCIKNSFGQFMFDENIKIVIHYNKS